MSKRSWRSAAISVLAAVPVLLSVGLLAMFHHYQAIVDERVSRPIFNDAAQIYGISGADGHAQLITGLFDAKRRSKQRVLRYDEIPAVVVDAIVSVEDRRFFEHGGINYGRLAEGLAAPLLGHRRMQGGSTLTMQMARSFFLSNERSARRKLAEMMIATELERRFTKQQILAMYVNQVDMGQHGSFNVRGFGEAAQVYFGKDLGKLTLPEAATLAGVVNGPSYFSPYRHPDRATMRRNLVLQAMFDNRVQPGAGKTEGKPELSREQLEQAKTTPLKLAPPNAEADEAPFFVDLVRDELLSKYEENDLNNGGLRVYTGLDVQLQRAATEAVTEGMRRLNKPSAQVALIAVDPHSGAVLALTGGRNYGESQLNHATARRPTGSIFKPFVYAAAINTGISGDPSKAYTEATTIDTAEEDFAGEDGKAYRPHNFDSRETGGEVTLRFALAHSINTATVRLAQQVGYDKVVALARAAGITDVKATPAMAIGSYDATPLQMAGAYTPFANGGNFVSPQLVQSVHDAKGALIDEWKPEPANVLDPRVAFVLTDMLRAVIDEGTAAGVVHPRLQAPAAGKTGTSHDAWFAGYTSNLLCVVWVGNDDYSDIQVEGAKAAAPIWTGFMTRAHSLTRYRNMQPFGPPAGVSMVPLDKLTNLRATDKCPDDYSVVFIDGTVPRSTCDHPDGDTRNVFQKMFGLGQKGGTLPGGNSAPEMKKKGFWHRLFGGKDKRPPATETANPQ